MVLHDEQQSYQIHTTQQKNKSNFFYWKLPGFDLNDALDFGGVEGVDDDLPLSDLQLGLGVGDGGGDRGGVGEILAVSEGGDGSSLGVLPDIVVRELGGGSEERAEEGQYFASRWDWWGSARHWDN